MEGTQIQNRDRLTLRRGEDELKSSFTGTTDHKNKHEMIEKWFQRSGILKVNGVYKIYEKKSLFFFSIDKCFRRSIIYLLESKYF